MQDYELKILEQYNINVKSTRKTRGAFFCDTEQGLFLLKKAGISEKRAPMLYRLGETLIKAGYTGIDQILPNAEGSFVSVSEDGGKYLLKQWYCGRECDIRRTKELFESVKNLARLHTLMVMLPEEPVLPEGSALPERSVLPEETGCPEGMEGGVSGEYILQEAHLKEIYESHNRELRKVRKFIRGRPVKGDFEIQFLKEFDSLYEWAEAAVSELAASGYESLYRDSIAGGRLVHGEYNYHNILITGNGMVTTNFEKFRRNVQAEDLYYFLRKSMEKHGWNVHLCDCMLNAYSAVRPIGRAEMEYLKIRFVYPEKFWKIAGSYYRSNKAWISVKNVEKFQTAVTQVEEKKTLLEDIFAYQM